MHTSRRSTAAGLAAALLTLALMASDGGSLRADLLGANEAPPVETATVGKIKTKLGADGTELDIKLKIKDANAILGAAGAHLHCAPAGTNGPVVAFITGSNPGGYVGDLSLDVTLTIANVVNTGTPCGSNLEEIVDAARDGLVYVNVHSSTFPGGEIRGQLEG